MTKGDDMGRQVEVSNLNGGARNRRMVISFEGATKKHDWPGSVFISARDNNTFSFGFHMPVKDAKRILEALQEAIKVGEMES